MKDGHKPAILYLLNVEADIDKNLNVELSNFLIIERSDNYESLYSKFKDGLRPPDMVILGLSITDPIHLSQRIHVYDKRIPIIIITEPLKCERLKRTLMYSPFLGNEISVRTKEDLDGLPVEIKTSIQRKVQKTAYDNAIANTHISFEKLPLLRPEATHYIDQLLDHAPIGVITIDLDRSILTINPQALRIIGISERAALEVKFEQHFPEYERQRLVEFIKVDDASILKKGPKVFELNAIVRGISYIEITLAPMNYRTGKRCAMLILQDVTDRVDIERKRQTAVDELLAHTQLLKEFHELTSNTTLTFEKKLKKILRLGMNYFGLSTGVFSHIDNKKFTVIQSITDNSRFVEKNVLNLDETFCGGVLSSEQPAAYTHIGNSPWCELLCYKLTQIETYIGTKVLLNGSPYGSLCFLGQSEREQTFKPFDLETMKLISQWISSELKREQTEEYMLKLSSAIEQTANAVMITDRERRIEYVNPAFEELTGYSRSEVIGEKTYFLRSGAHDQDFYTELWDLISNGGVYRGILVNRRKNGSLYHEQKTITPLKDEQGLITHFISTGHDITQIVEAQERDRKHKAELAHVARLSVLGEMTSSLAHELNQPLCAIITYAQTSIRVINSGGYRIEDLRYGLQQIVHQAEQGGAIFKRLRNFARKGEFKKLEVNVLDIIQEVENFIKAEAHQNAIKFKVEAPVKVPKTLIDPIQIEQVMINLARNAMDAMSDSEVVNRQITVKVKCNSKFIKISLIDTGRGCPPELVNRLFEPFFTTKTNGLGIGLSISQNIIDEHGGKLWVEANTIKGTTFSFTLPIEKELSNG